MWDLVVRVALVLAVSLLAATVTVAILAAAHAQQADAPILPKDPRVAPAAIDLMAAQLTYSQAVDAARQQDAKRLAEWWAEYLKGLPSCK